MRSNNSNVNSNISIQKEEVFCPQKVVHQKPKFQMLLVSRIYMAFPDKGSVVAICVLPMWPLGTKA